jgi:hypothetical protein
MDDAQDPHMFRHALNGLFLTQTLGWCLEHYIKKIYWMLVAACYREKPPAANAPTISSMLRHLLRNKIKEYHFSQASFSMRDVDCSRLPLVGSFSRC